MRIDSQNYHKVCEYFKTYVSIANTYNGFLTSHRGQNFLISKVVKKSTSLITVLLEVVLHGKVQSEMKEKKQEDII